jgi:hypothetical protein
VRAPTSQLLNPFLPLWTRLPRLGGNPPGSRSPYRRCAWTCAVSIMGLLLLCLGLVSTIAYIVLRNNICAPTPPSLLPLLSRPSLHAPTCAELAYRNVRDETMFSTLFRPFHCGMALAVQLAHSVASARTRHPATTLLRPFPFGTQPNADVCCCGGRGDMDAALGAMVRDFVLILDQLDAIGGDVVTQLGMVFNGLQLRL